MFGSLARRGYAPTEVQIAERSQPHRAPSRASTDVYVLRRREALFRWFAWTCEAAGHHRVLVLGSGDGYGAAILASAGLDVVGVDTQTDAAARTYRFGRIAFRTGDPSRTDEPQHSFDAAIACGVLERLAEPQTLFGEARRILRPDGLFVVATPNRLTASPGRTRPIAGDHEWEYTPDELHNLMRWRFADAKQLGVFHGRRLRLVERMLGDSLPLTLGRVSPHDRAIWLRAALARVRATDFEVGAGVVRDALDLIGIGEARS